MTRVVQYMYVTHGRCLKDVYNAGCCGAAAPQPTHAASSDGWHVRVAPCAIVIVRRASRNVGRPRHGNAPNPDKRARCRRALTLALQCVSAPAPQTPYRAHLKPLLASSRDSPTYLCPSPAAPTAPLGRSDGDSCHRVSAGGLSPDASRPVL